VELEIRNKLPFMLTPQDEILSINLRIYVQDIYKENCKTLMKDIKQELNKQDTLHVFE
jgi:hypothetical protein